MAVDVVVDDVLVFDDLVVDVLEDGFDEPLLVVETLAGEEASNVKAESANTATTATARTAPLFMIRGISDSSLSVLRSLGRAMK